MFTNIYEIVEINTPCVGRGPWAGQDILAFLLLNNFFELYHTSLEAKTLIGWFCP